MSRSLRRFGVLALVALYVSLFALTALADDHEESGPAEAEVISETGLEPAVPIPEEAEAETVADWTYRYMIPATLVLTVVVIVMTSIRYFTQVVRNRYRTVEE